MKKRVRTHHSLGMQMREPRHVEDFIQHLEKRKLEITSQGKDMVLIELLDACDSDDGMARLVLIGERDETNQEYAARTKVQEKLSAAREANERALKQDHVVEVLRDLSQKEALELWRKARQK